ncbi:Hypothetical predicted protein [Xyrichtys novacula]|uniref:Uncharacterized protein n=1 Tax=Xyrichtys novacula TaxID=13765 RepID=A0AAV1F4I6_XYRNO|nr:Hypothetical predicted protein [Xyrichtys novacula]
MFKVSHGRGQRSQGLLLMLRPCFSGPVQLRSTEKMMMKLRLNSPGRVSTSANRTAPSPTIRTLLFPAEWSIQRKIDGETSCPCRHHVPAHVNTQCPSLSKFEGPGQP